jgi:hypothetical protein
MLGKWGKVVHKALAHRHLFVSPHFGEWGECWGSGGRGVAFGLWPKGGAYLAKRAFGHKHGGDVAMRWPKEEGTDFAGHRMAKKSAPQHGQREPHPSLATHWPKKPPRSAFGHK